MIEEEKEDYSKNSFHFGGENTALLLVDFQNEFVSEGGKLHGKVWQSMNDTSMMTKVPKVLQKAHDINATVVHSRIILQSESSTVWRNQNVWDSIRLVKGLFNAAFWNTDFAKELEPSPADLVCHREHFDAFKETDLEEHLKKKNIDKIFIAGFLTDICISETVKTASKKGFNVYTLSDGCAAKSGGAHCAALTSLCSYSTVLPCEEALKLLDPNITCDEKEEICDKSTTASLLERTSLPNSAGVGQGEMNDQRPSVLNPETPIFFMIGSERSGYRWLVKKALAARDDVWIPHPPRILRTFMPTLNTYGNLHEDENLKLLVEAVCTLVEKKKKEPWLDKNGERIIFDRENIMETAKNSVDILRIVRSGRKNMDQRIFLMSIFDEIMNVGAVQNGKRTWMNLAREDAQYNSLFMTYYGKERLRYLYTVRDPRDVLMSYKETPATGAGNEPSALGKNWAEEQQTALKILSRNKNIVHTIKYEKLLHDNDEVLKGIDSFLDNSTDADVAAEGRDDDKDSGTSSIKSWRDTLSEEEVNAIEFACSRQMTTLGYQLEVYKPPPLTKATEGMLNFKDMMGQKKKESNFAEGLSKLAPSFLKGS